LEIDGKMPPVAAGIAAIGTFLNTAAFAVAGSIGLSAGATFAGISVFQQLAAGVALSALSRALAPKPPGLDAGRPAGMKIRIASGEDQPQSFIFGKYATPGDIVYRNSFGEEDDTPNVIYTMVIELADVPTSLLRIAVNGEYITLGKTAHSHFGFPVKQYRKDDKDHLWIKYYDGTQTTADFGLVDIYGDPGDEHKWKSTSVGRGIAYAVVWSRYNPEIHRQVPEVLFELQGIHYDPRKDSTAGGSGAQRFTNRSTWKPSNNLAVLIYNVKRGVHDPITGEFIWGGRATARDLPASDWFAAMNECDRLVATSSGSEPQYQGGLEIRVSDEPSSVIEEFLKGCQGVIAEYGGSWAMRAGPPLLPVLGIDDGDIVITEEDELDPYPGLDKAYNQVAAVYPEPTIAWQPKDAPIRSVLSYVADDGGRERTAKLDFLCVWNKRQVQRLMLSGLHDQRRYRRHTLVLPPEAQFLTPLDEISWNSSRNGYINKLFSVDATEIMPNGNVAVALRERDPNDYDWESGMELPTVINPPVRPPVIPHIGNFDVEPATVKDSAGNDRRPAIRLFWTETTNVTGVQYRVRLASDHSHVPVSSAGVSGERQFLSDALTIGGSPLTFGGESLIFNFFDDEDALQVFIIGVLPLTQYEVQAIFTPTSGRVLSEWMPVLTPDIRLGEDDLEDEIRDRIQDALDEAQAAADAVALISAHVTDLDAQLAGLSAEVIADLNALVASINALDLETLGNLSGAVVAGLIEGWGADPKFHAWSAGNLTKWTTTGITTYGSQDLSGTYKSSLHVNVPSGSALVSIRASSDVPGQLLGADPTVEYVVVSCKVLGIAGSFAGSELRAEWKNGSGVWIKGDSFGLPTLSANLSTHWKFVVNPDRFQSNSVVFKRPASVGINPPAVCVHLVIHQSSPTLPIEARFDVVDIRPATEAEIKAHNANGYVDAEISEFSATILSPTGALATQATTLRTEFNAADALINTALVTVSNDVQALAGQVSVIEASFNGGNLVTNPRFDDGDRPAGEAPRYWNNWPADWDIRSRAAGGSAAIAVAPTPFMGQTPVSTALSQARAITGQPVKAGDIIPVSLMAAGVGTAISVNAQIAVVWKDPQGAQIGATDLRTLLVNSTSWVSSSFTDYVAPSGASTFDLWVRRAAGGSLNSIVFTNVEARFADRGARAAINTVSAAQASTAQALATQTSTVTAEFGSYSAFVSAAATALATADKAASAIVFRVIGGSAGLYGWNDETGIGAAFRVDARNFIATGTISAQELVISDTGANIVPDNQLLTENAWTDVGNGDWLILDSTTANAVSLGELRFIHPGGTLVGNSVSRSRSFPVRGGQSFYATAQARKLSGTTLDINVRVRFADRDGVALGFGQVGSYTGTAATTLAFSGEMVAPTGTVSAQWEWIVWEGSTAGVRFFGPSLIRREPGSVLITPNSITAREANFVDLASLGLKVVRADIVAAAVGTLEIAGFAVTDDDSIVTEVNAAGNGSTRFYTPLALTVVVPNNGTRVEVSVYVDTYNNTGSVLVDWAMDIVYGSSVAIPGAKANSIYYQSCIPMLGLINLNAGTYTFRMRYEMPSNTGIYRGVMIVRQRKR
jgi:hypothetical protein